MKRSYASMGIAAAAVSMLATTLLAAPAGAAPTVSDPIAEGLAGPLQLDVVGDKVVVAQSFIGVLSRVKSDGTLKELHAEDNAEVSGVAIEGKRVAFLTTSNDEENPAAFLKVLRADGTVDKIANLAKYEAALNPDGDVTYGIRDLSQECQDELPPEAFGIAPYPGETFSHPYGLVDAPGGGWFVADAGANTILKVTPNGSVNLVAILPPQVVEVTQAAAEANNLPPCTVGEMAYFEPVPTDVEVNRDGMIIASLLPGGPEDPSFGARGAVVQVRPSNGKVKPLVGGLAGATNVAVVGGRIYVNEIGGSRITKITQDLETKLHAEVPTPGGLEFANGQLYAGVGVFSESGELVTVAP